MRYLITYLLIAILSVSQVACTTTTNTEGFHSSQVKISSFLVSPDRGTLVVVSQQYHFIMTLQEPLRSIMQWKSLYKLNPSFGTFIVNSDQSVKGSYTLQASLKKLQPDEQRFLKQQGFRLNSDASSLIFSASIQGTRYLAGEVSLSKRSHFTQAYNITMLESNKSSGSLDSILTTPITVAVDGVFLILGTAILIPSLLLFPESFR